MSEVNTPTSETSTETSTPTIPVVAAEGLPKEAMSERNGVSIKFVQAEKRKTKSDKVGQIVMSIDKPTTDEDYDAILGWLGKKDAALLAYQKLKQYAVNFTAKFTKEGVFNLEEFLKAIVALSPRAETNADLKAELADLQKQLFAALSDASLRADKAAFEKRMDEVGSRMKEISETLAFRAAAKEDDEDGEDATVPQATTT